MKDINATNEIWAHGIFHVQWEKRCACIQRDACSSLLVHIRGWFVGLHRLRTVEHLMIEIQRQVPSQLPSHSHLSIPPSTVSSRSISTVIPSICPSSSIPNHYFIIGVVLHKSSKEADVRTTRTECQSPPGRPSMAFGLHPFQRTIAWNSRHLTRIGSTTISRTWRWSVYQFEYSLYLIFKTKRRCRTCILLVPSIKSTPKLHIPNRCRKIR